MRKFLEILAVLILPLLFITSMDGVRAEIIDSLKQKNTLRVGGSMYLAFHNTADYYGTLNPVTKKFDASTLKTVFGQYHTNPARVNSQLTQMYDSGQRQIGFIVHYARFPQPADLQKGYKNHMVASNGGTLQPTQKQNFDAVLGKVRDLGFERVILRFGAQALNDPATTACGTLYNSSSSTLSYYEENYAFIKNTYAEAKKVLSGSKTEILVDLGGELPGKSGGCVDRYIQDIYTRFNQDFPGAYKFAYFSINPVLPGTADSFVTKYFNTLKKQPFPLPEFIAVDTYGYGLGLSKPVAEWDIYSMLRDIQKDIVTAGQNSKKVIIQETFYNDSRGAQDIARAMKEYGIKIDTVIQWPVARNATYQNFLNQGIVQTYMNIDTPNQYGEYLKITPAYDVTFTNSSGYLSFECTEDTARTKCLKNTIIITKPNPSYVTLTVWKDGGAEKVIACIKTSETTTKLDLPWLLKDSQYGFKLYDVGKNEKVCRNIVGKKIIQGAIVRRNK
ncbi:MAG: hypothetical protein WAZ27_03650 [Minisyncoccia bacterium]